MIRIVAKSIVLKRLNSAVFGLLLSTASASTCSLATDADAPRTQVIAMDADPILTDTLRTALTQRGPDYAPRTEHNRPDGSPVYINRLILEDSPYLIQHAHNPVNWYAWGDEAFSTAQRDNKPIFLSIGYATCHWCHVMERESFENEAIAKLLNDNYIAIKVDREQRPDVDAIYMSAVQLISGSGGWPMSSWLSPEGKPFYGGTYYPPADFSKVLTRMVDLWANEQPMLLEQAEKLSAAVADSHRLSGDVSNVTSREIDTATSYLLSVHDDLQGGFTAAPKFPQEPSLFLLLEEARRNGNSALLNAAHFSLQQMAAGGIHDQIGGGFHRYSVDNEWLVPHFEKMLYNQAALSRNYLLAFQLNADPEHARTASRTLDYVMREMTSPEGGFYSATDADSEGEEGLYFTWTPEELVTALGPSDAALAISVWGVTTKGNFEDRNILHLEGSTSDSAEQHNLTTGKLRDKLNDFSARLRDTRAKRVPPLLDDKIITEWNGMMITAFAEAADVLNEPKYLTTAIQAAAFLWDKNKQTQGGLWRAHFAGRSSIDASQSDYAYLSEAMLTLYDVTHESRWLTRAVELTDTMEQLFWDNDQGAYFIGPAIVNGAALPTRPKDLYDNATPSGNAVALRVLTRLWHRTGEERYREHAQRLLLAFSPYLSDYPSAFGYLLTAASELLSGETGYRQYAARGNVRIEVRREDTEALSVNIDIAPGWHINAQQPLQEYLIGTSLTRTDNKRLENLHYPAAKHEVLGFERAELALYDGEVSITADLPPTVDGASIVALSLQLQACNDKVCLAPESVTLNLSVTELQ